MKNCVNYIFTLLLIICSLNLFSQSRKYSNVPPGSKITVERGCIILANESLSIIGNVSYQKNNNTGKTIEIQISFIPRSDFGFFIPSAIFHEIPADEQEKTWNAMNLNKAFDNYKIKNTINFDRYLTVGKVFEVHSTKVFNDYQNIHKMIVLCTDGSFFEFRLDATGGIKPRYSDPDPIRDLPLEEFINAIKKYLTVDIKTANPYQEY